MDQQFAQILQIQQQQAVVVGILKGDVQHAFLRFGQIHQA